MGDCVETKREGGQTSLGPLIVFGIYLTHSIVDAVDGRVLSQTMIFALLIIKV